jgi:hypothetical protein
MTHGNQNHGKLNVDQNQKSIHAPKEGYSYLFTYEIQEIKNKISCNLSQK